MTLRFSTAVKFSRLDQESSQDNDIEQSRKTAVIEISSLGWMCSVGNPRVIFPARNLECHRMDVCLPAAMCDFNSLVKFSVYVLGCVKMTGVYTSLLFLRVHTWKSHNLSKRCVWNGLCSKVCEQVVTLLLFQFTQHTTFIFIFIKLLQACCRKPASNLLRASDIRLVATTCKVW